MVDYDFWIMFLGVSIALNVSPGPDVLYILTKTISGGKKVGFASSLGVCTGALFHVGIASLGLSSILIASSLAFNIVKYIGVLYLLYLAYHSFRSSGARFDIKKNKKVKQSAWSAYKQGVLVDILNPKVAIFFMAFLPQFIREGQGSIPFQFVYLGLFIIIVAIFIEGLYVLLASKITNKIRSNRKISLYLDRVVGIIFVSLGIRLAVSSN